MGGATIWPVPRAIDAEAHYYPRKWKRNLFVLYSGAMLISFQINRYGHLCRVSLPFLVLMVFQGKFFKQTCLSNLFCCFLCIVIVHAYWRIHGLGIASRSQTCPLRLNKYDLKEEKELEILLPPHLPCQHKSLIRTIAKILKIIESL